MSKYTYTFATVLLSFVILGAGCSSNNTAEDTQNNESPQAQQMQKQENNQMQDEEDNSDSMNTDNMDDTTSSDSSEDMKVVEVSGTEYSFSPSDIEVEKGQKVKVKFTNTGKAPHDFRIPSLGVGTEIIDGGETDSFTFTAEEKGSYPIKFECSVPGHAQQGMTGELIVS
jgi:plastocyanin